MKTYYVYILSSKRNGTLYTGITSNLKRRIYEHKHHKTQGFTAKYKVTTLVYFETFTYVNDAIQREKQLKWWKRSWKIKLIEDSNPTWNDLYETII